MGKSRKEKSRETKKRILGPGWGKKDFVKKKKKKNGNGTEKVKWVRVPSVGTRGALSS